MRKFLLFWGAFLCIIYAYAQQGMGQGGHFGKMGQMMSQLEPNKGAIFGKVVDHQGKGLEFTTVTLYRQKDSTVVDGALTDSAGRFALINVPYGTYFLEVKFIGFRKKAITNIKVSPTNRFVRIGRIQLEQKAEQLQEVVVTAQKKDVEYRVDKKVINVSQNLSSVNGTAVDVLQNVPSVEVDIQGNVTLRGSGNFTVLINGKPSVLDGSEALQQIPASEIEKIEIITNPSAKYDPDGVAGIINVITKRPKEKGYNGNITVSYDNYNSLRANAIFNVRYKKFNFFIGFNKNQRVRPADVVSQRIITYDTIKNVFYNTGQSEFRRGGWTAKTGFNYYATDKTTWTFTGKIGQKAFLMNSESYFDQYTMINDTKLNELFYKQIGYANSSGWMYQADIDFDHKFDNNGHKITAYAYISNWMPYRVNGTLVDTTDANWNSISSSLYGQESRENRTGLKARLQVDYERPLSNGRKLEAGYSGRYIEMTSDYKFFESTSDDWTELTDRANFLKLSRNIQAAYVTYTGKLKNWFSYQLGLRSEFVDRIVDQQATSELYEVKRLDLFPTFHVSKRFGKNNQIQFGYSRRVNRPNGWYLNPFPLYIDQYTIMQGNPQLLPEFANAFELNYIKNFKAGYFSVETFYRQKVNKFERIQTVSDNNVLIYTWTNAGQDQASGAEFSLNYMLMKMFMINASTSVYYYQLEGELDQEQVNTSTLTWNSRLMLMAMLPTMTKVQIMAYYRAPTVTLQGYREGMIFSSIAVRQDFFKRKLSATLSVNDPFKLAKFSFVTDVDNLYTSTEYILKSPQISLTLSLRINNYKPQRQQKGQEDISEFEGEGLY